MTSLTIASRSAFAARNRRTVRVGTRIRTPENGSTSRSNARNTSASASCDALAVGGDVGAEERLPRDAHRQSRHLR